MQSTSGFSAECAGHIASMGLMCGVYGINVAHELGHRPSRFEQLLSKTMLLSSLYMHFFIEHNRGHHRNVGTPDDPATARRGENIYRFWMRSLTMSVVSAWHIVARERKRKSLSTWSVRNEFIQYALLEITLCITIYLLFGAMAAIAFVIAAVIGMLLLESVNYIEHYGLMRTRINDKRYEDVLPVHSWNSDFVLGRLVLFELTRHSDHHSEPSKHYQYLASMPTSGQLPAGYPAMLVLSLFPPLWFRVMDHRIPLKSA
ncbi:MAG: alkane 1-monooxygenase [Flavobacteriales bacterium]|nr:alkane 1-monooxygenase [Flavobacteriales bacterium]